MIDVYISVSFVTGKSYANYCPGLWEVSYYEWVKALLNILHF